MSTSFSYPGIYVQELPLSTQTISPAPTSITAFVGYTNPWKTQTFNQAVPLFSFSDFEAKFGGIYTSGIIPSDLARAVYAFFLNGGTYAYVVGLPASAQATGGPVPFGLDAGDLCFTATINPDPGDMTVGLQFLALVPTDVVPMTAKIANLRINPATPGKYTLFDLTISYASQVEVYRGLDLTIAPGAAGSVDVVVNKLSALVKIQAVGGGATYGAQFVIGAPPKPPAAVTFSPVTLPSTPGLPAGFTGVFAAADFLGAFDDNSSLDTLEIFNLLLVPGVSDNSVLSRALSFAERKRAFTIVDPPAQATAFPVPPSSTQDIGTLAASLPLSQNGALYFPYLLTSDPITGNPTAVAPGGYVAGIYASTDASRGVWKAPAGLATSLLGTTGPIATGLMNDMQQGVLNLLSVNCLRTFTGAGTVVYGARTLVAGDDAFAQSKYVPVRRMTLFIEQSLVASLKWVVFEPNDVPLWLAIKSSIEAFLLALFNQGALQGPTPSQAFQVKCDSTTTTPADQQLGVVNIVVGVALLKPAEFVVIKISQLAGQTS